MYRSNSSGNLGPVDSANVSTSGFSPFITRITHCRFRSLDGNDDVNLGSSNDDPLAEAGGLIELEETDSRPASEGAEEGRSLAAG